MRLEKFLFCEVARQEKSGQLTILGLIPADRIGFEVGPNTPIELVSFCCVVVLDYMQGIRTVTYQLEVKFGDQVIQRTPSATANRDDPSARNHVFVVSIQPFAFPGAGDYTFKLIVQSEGETTSFSRRLRVDSARPATAMSH